jgi:dienelactone hydrolase
MAYLNPIVGQAAEEFPAALAQLREQLPVNNGALGVVGGSAGGAVALEILTRTEIPIKAAALVNPAVRARSVVELLQDTIGGPYLWNEQPRAAADRLDFVARAGDIAARTPQPPLLVISGELDFPMLRADAAELVGLTTVANLPHPLAEQPGLEPAPQLSATKVVDEAMTQWFLCHLTAR